MKSDKLQEALMLALQNKLTENKSTRTKTEARRNPLAKVGDTDNRSYGRDLEYPDEIYALQSIWDKLQMDMYGEGSSDRTGLGDLINEYENGELTIRQIESELPVVYDLLDADIGLSEDAENSTLSSVIGYKDIRDICQEVLNDQLANADMLFTVTLDDYGDMDFYIDNIKYNGQNEEVKKFVGVFNKLGDAEKYEMLTSYDDNEILNDRFRSLQKRTQTDLDNNSVKHKDIAYYGRQIKDYVNQITDLKAKLSKMKNYNKATQLQKELDNAEHWLKYIKDERQKNIDSILSRVKKELDNAE